MCVWCEQFGNGDRWYFNPANYARRLYKVRKEEVEAAGAEANLQGGAMGGISGEYLEARLKGDHDTVARIKRETEERTWRTHFGQVVTLEEACKIADLIYPIARMTCGCRRGAQGLSTEDNLTCIGMGPGMYKWERWPETYRGGVEFISPEELKDLLTKLNKQGLVHIVATFGTPYFGGICNCDYPDCSFIRDTVDYDIRRAWRGHYVAKVDPALCNGCAVCVKRCQFKALHFSGTRNAAIIDAAQCFGCGLCENVCKVNAIKMVERASLPALESVW